MKNGKNPTVKQKEFIKSKRLNPANWLVSKDTRTEMVIVSRVDSNKVKTIKKGVIN